MRVFAILAVLWLSVTAVAADDPILTVPQLSKPAAKPAEGDPLQAKYDAAWTTFEEAVGKVTAEVTKALDAQFEKAADSGNLDLADMWDKKKKFFLDTKTLEWASDGKAKVEWRKKYPSNDFPEDFSETVKKAKQAYDAAVEELKQGYEGIVREYTKARNLERAKQLKEELAGLERTPSAQPEQPKSPETKISEGMVRIAYTYAIDGSTKTTVQAVKPMEGRRQPYRKDKVRPGVWRATHVFDDTESVTRLQGPLFSMRSVSFDGKRVGLLFNPKAAEGSKAAMQYPTRFRLPVTVEIDVVAVSDHAQLQITPNANTPQNIHPFVTITTSDGFRTVDVTDGWVVSRDPNTGQPQIKDVATLRGVSTAKPVVLNGKAPVAISPEETSLLSLGAFAGDSGASDGYLLKALVIESRLLPTLGLNIKQEGDIVIAKDVLPKSLADAAGLKAGDRIVAIDGRPVETAQGAVNGLAMTQYGDTWKLEIERDGERKKFTIKAE